MCDPHHVGFRSLRRTKDRVEHSWCSAEERQVRRGPRIHRLVVARRVDAPRTASEVALIFPPERRQPANCECDDHADLERLAQRVNALGVRHEKVRSHAADRHGGERASG